jgi:hypothetical protein
VARRSRHPVQQPKSASGFRLCRHRTAGGCTNFCQYKLFAKIVTAAVLLIGGICAAVWFGAEGGQGRVKDVGYGLGTFLAIAAPLIIIENRRDPD